MHEIKPVYRLNVHLEPKHQLALYEGMDKHGFKKMSPFIRFLIHNADRIFANMNNENTPKQKSDS